MYQNQQQQQHEPSSASSSFTSVADLTLAHPYIGHRDAAGNFHGRGKLTLLGSNITYHGEFLHGRKHGVGKQTWPDGSSFCGEWVHGEAAGFGQLTLPDGGEYFGEIKGGVRSGLGVYRAADGSRYFGHWKNGKRHGFGIEIGEDGTFTGEWLHNSRHGWGTMQFGASLNRYTGEWEHDTMHGVGSMVWVSLKDQNRAKKLWRRASSKMLMGIAAEKERMQHKSNRGGGDSNENSFRSRRGSKAHLGAISAQSLMLSSDDMQQYVGEWDSGCPHGNGELRRILLTSSTSNSKDDNGNKKSNHRSIPFEMGNHFQGSFKYGRRDGFGIQYFADGSAFEGTWQKNLKHGRGTIIRADGKLVHVSLLNDTIISRTEEEDQEEREKESFVQHQQQMAAAESAAECQQEQSKSHQNSQQVTPGRQQQQQHQRQQSGANESQVTSTSVSQQYNNNNSLVTDPQQQQTPQLTTHVDISVKDICYSTSDERSVHITISLVFVALRHLFHVYVGMQSGCGNFDDIYSAETHSKLPEGVQKRSAIKPPKFVKTMSEEILKATPIHHLSDFEGTVHLAEANAEHTLQLAARAAQKAMRTVTIFEMKMKKDPLINAEEKRLKAAAAAAASHHQHHHYHHNQHEMAEPMSPILSSNSPSPTHDDIVNKFIAWTSQGDNLDDDDDDELEDSELEDRKRQQKNAAANRTKQPSVTSPLATSTANDPFSDIPTLDIPAAAVDANNKNQKERSSLSTPPNVNAAGVDPRASVATAIPTIVPKATFDEGSLLHDDDEEHNKSNNNKDHRPASIEELFGQYDGAANAASASASNKSAAGSAPAERRPLSTVLQLAGFMSLLRDAEILSPDMTGSDVLDALEPLLARRAHVPGAPGLTWPAFVESIVRIAHKKLALSPLFCAQDQTAKSNLGARLHHFVKEYLYPLLRCVKDMEACAEASAIIGVEQLEIAASENTTFDSLRKATLRQLRAMTGQNHHHHHQAGRNRGSSMLQNTSEQQTNNMNSHLFDGGDTNNAVGFDEDVSNDDLINSGTASGQTTPRSVSESSVFQFGGGGSRQQVQPLPVSFDEAILVLAKQVESSICQKIGGCNSNSNNNKTRSSSQQQQQNQRSNSFTQASNTSISSVANLTTTTTTATITQLAPVTRGLELLQTLCGGSWSQFPSVVQCEVVEKIQLQSASSSSLDESHYHRHHHHHSSTSGVQDAIEVWCVVSQPEKYSPSIRVHLLLVQIAKHTSEVRFVGFVPTTVIERLCVQSKRDPEFFEKLAQRALFMTAKSNNSSPSPILPSSSEADGAGPRKQNSFGSRLSLQQMRRKSSAVSNFSQMTTSTAAADALNNTTNSSINNMLSTHQQLIEHLSKFNLAHFVAASASHQLIRGSRFYSTASLVHYDSLVRLYHTCNRSLGPLVAACTFSGIFLYPGEDNNSNKKKHENAKRFPVSSTDVLRHCIHALYGIDPVTSTGGLFIDIKSNYTGYLSNGRRSITATNTSASTTKTTTTTTTSGGDGGDLFNNNNEVQQHQVTLLSPDEAAAAVMQALQTLVRNSRSSVVALQGGAEAANRKFAEIAEAAKSRAALAIKTEDERMMYHGDNWRARKRKSVEDEEHPHWPLAASDLKLSFGEFVECIMVICGLSQQEKKKSGDDEEDSVSVSSSEEEDDDETETEDEDFLSKTFKEKEEKQIDQALKSVMRAATSTIGKRFVNEKKSENQSAADKQQQQQQQQQQIQAQQQQQRRKSIGAPKTIACSTSLLESFLQEQIPIIQYFVELRNSVPKLIPSYWAWSIIDCFDPLKKNQVIDDSRSGFVKQQQEREDEEDFSDTTASRITQLESLRADFVKTSLKQRALSAGIFSTNRKNGYLSKKRQKQEAEIEKRRKLLLEQKQKRSSVASSGEEKMQFMGRPLSPIAFLGTSSTSGAAEDKKLRRRLEAEEVDPNLHIKNKNKKLLPPHTDKKQVEKRRALEKKNEISVVDATVIPQDVFLEDETLLFEILQKKELKKLEEEELVEKLQKFHNKRYDEVLARLQKQQEEEEAEADRLRQVEMMKRTGRRGSSAGARSGRRPLSPNSPSSAARNRSSSMRSTGGNSSGRSSQGRGGPLSPSNAFSPGRGGGGGKKNKKNIDFPKMAVVVKKVSVGTSVADGSGGKIASLVRDELVLEQKKNQDENTNNNNAFYDDRLNHKIPHPSSIQQVVQQGMLLETPPVQFTVKRVEEAPVDRLSGQSGDSANNQQKSGKDRTGGSNKRIGSPAEKSMRRKTGQTY